MAEKSLTDLPRELRMLFNKGNDALLRENFDYAIDLFGQVLKQEPAIYECRKALRMAQLRKAGGGGGFFKKILSNAGSSPQIAKGQLALRKDPGEALEIAEQILNHDPNSSPGHRLVVEAATALEMPRTAVLSLEILARNSPKDRDIAIKLANSLADTGDVVRAERILTELHDLYPTDNDLAQALKNISARRTMDKGGYEAAATGDGSYRDILKDKEEAASLEQENRQHKTEDTAQRLIEEKELRLKADPKNVRLMRDLAELYTQKKQFEQALGYYQRIKATDAGSDASLDRGIADTMSRKFDHDMGALDSNAPDYPEALEKLKSDKQAYLLTECQKRAERFPTDLQIKFELGQLYFQLGKVNEAIAEFQKAQVNPHRKVPSLNYLAQCFAKKKMYDLAVRQLQAALKEKPALDEEKKELLYNYGSVLESMGKAEEAIEQFKTIYEVDAGYKDVSAKIDKFYSGS